jgi:putative transposase
MPQDPTSMYRWRRWTPEQREQVLKERRAKNHPDHSPAHVCSDLTTYYLITAACYEHQPHIGYSDQRLAAFCDELCCLFRKSTRQLFEWVVLPNHYHALVDSTDILGLLKCLGQLHGRSSYEWNAQEISRGRRVWCNACETAMKSEGHFYASINYVLNNPVHHRYCEKWTDWPFSSVHDYLARVGRDLALARWRSFPLYDYGATWDPPQL